LKLDLPTHVSHPIAYPDGIPTPKMRVKVLAN
jgi:hypothetical protein